MNILEAYKFCPICGSKHFVQKGSNKLCCEACGYELYLNPKIGAVAMIEDENGRLLAVRRSKNPAKGTWHLPGGIAEIEETIEDAVKREVKEELNIDVEVTSYLFSIPNLYEYKGIEYYPLDFFMLCKIKDMSNILVDTSENSEYSFMPLSEINVEEFGLPSIRAGIRRYIELKKKA